MNQTGLSNKDDPLRRAAWQRLQSLHRAGVDQIPRPGPVRQIKPLSIDSTTEEAAPSQLAASEAGPKADQVAEPQVPYATEVTEPAAVATTPPAENSGGDRIQQLKVLSAEVAGCTACEELCSKRTQTVFGVGNPAARLCFLGEAPGADEDRMGEPFVGKAGQLLTKIIEAMSLTRDDVYILNILKCRPPGNRNPDPKEVDNCRSYFERQLAIIQPEFICCVGSVAAQNLLNTTTTIGKLRGRFHDWQGHKVMATYHPAYLLRNPSAKKLVWEDMQYLMKAMGLTPPAKTG